jgi:hypothetical protein
VNRPRLALQDDPIDGGLHLGVSRHVGLVKLSDEPDTQPAYPACQPGRIVPGGRRSATGIERIMFGDDVEHQRIVGNGARQQSDVAEREGERENATTRNQAVSRLESDDAASAGRVTHLPPVSLPGAIGNRPAATPAPDPEDEPPG